MPAIVYPAALPEPAAFPFSPRERRAVSSQQGLTQLRSRAREQIVDAKGVRWIYTPAEMDVWRAWFEDDLALGLRWFAVSLPGRSGWQTRVARYVTGTVREHKGAGFFEVAADLEINGSRVPPIAYGASLVVDVDAVTNGGTSSAVGVIVSGLDPVKNYRLSMEPGGTYVAWDSNAGGGGSWKNRFRVTTTGGENTYGSLLGDYVTPELARSHFVPVTVTGFDTYIFWIVDNAPGDNVGGLSITVTES